MVIFVLMVQRIIAIFLLLSHLNSNMLLPQLEEQDMYHNGHEMDDINSVMEYIGQEIFDIPDASPEDEDDDKGRNFRLLKSGNEICECKLRSFVIAEPDIQKCQTLFDNESANTLMIYDILTPPPRA